MILIRNKKVVVEAKREQKLFTLNLAYPKKDIAIINLQLKAYLSKPRLRKLVMAMTRRKSLTYLVSQNKRIQLWHLRLAYISNVRILRAAKLVDEMKLDVEKKYDPAEVLINSDNSNVFESKETITTAVARQTTESDELDIMDKFYTPYIGSKLTQVVRQNKSITATTKKLEEVHINLWGSHNLLSQSSSVYSAILIYKHTCKS